jgi:DNA-binding MarR family transcriptional regulator
MESPSGEQIAVEWTDEAVRAWQREHPDLDLGSLIPLLRLEALTRSLEAFQRGVLEPLELSVSDYRALTGLQPSGRPEPQTPTRLAQRLGHTTGGMTKILRRLETRGLVDRRIDPDDARGFLIELTARGRTTLERALRAFALASDHRLTAIPPREREEIARTFARFAAAFDASDPSAVPAPDRRRRNAPRTNR